MTPEIPKFDRGKRAAKESREQQPFGGGINKPEVHPPRADNEPLAERLQEEQSHPSLINPDDPIEKQFRELRLLLWKKYCDHPDQVEAFRKYLDGEDLHAWEVHSIVEVLVTKHIRGISMVRISEARL